MLDDVVEVEPRGEYCLWLQFQDGVEGEVDLGPRPCFKAFSFRSVIRHPSPVCASARSWDRSLAQ